MSLISCTIGEVRFLHTSDWHVGRVIRGRSRLEEHRAVLDEIINIAATEKVDLVIVAGDLFDTAAPSPESEKILYHSLLKLSEVAPVVAISGNHDNPRRLQAVAPLLRLGRVFVGASVDSIEENALEPIEGTKVATLPFLSRRSIVKAEELMSGSSGDHGSAYADRFRNVVSSLTTDMTPDTVNILVAHATVHGATPAGSERQAHIFGYAVGAGDFPHSFNYVALGHFHRQQKLAAEIPVWYSGSPIQLDFGESGERKGVLIVDAEPGGRAEVRSVPLVSGRRLIRLAGTIEEVVAESKSFEDAYFRIEIDDSPRSGLAEEVMKLIPGTVEVRVRSGSDGQGGEPTPARIGRQPHELFSEYLDQKQIEVPGLIELFNELLEEVHEA